MREWLREKREEMGVLQIDCAKACGITREFYSMIESGDRRPSPEVAKKIAAYLGFDWTKFFEDSQQEDSN